MKYTERILRKLLEALVPGVKKVLKILDSDLPDKEKLFKIRVELWDSESKVQDELKDFVENQLFSPHEDCHSNTISADAFGIKIKYHLN